MFPWLTAASLALLWFRPSYGFVDNGILGDPYVSCGGDQIDIRFDTRSKFRGIVFVEDHLGDPMCRSGAIGADTSERNASLSLNFKNCGIERKASADPKGIFLTTTVVVAFNPEFLTKIDRIYVVQCFYMEMKNSLEKQIQVNMKPPTFQTAQVPMPVCRYEVLDGGPSGPPVFYATIGQPVYHKWTCDAQTENQFCMIVHSCIVDDGNGDRVELINNEGCAHDKHLLANLEYVSDLMVGREAHVYKYADRQSMFFDCQITLTVKEPGEEYCPVPHCPDPPRKRRNNAAKAATDFEMPQAENTTEGEASSSVAKYILEPQLRESSSFWNDNFELNYNFICMTNFGMAFYATFNIVLIMTSGAFFASAARLAKSQ